MRRRTPGKCLATILKHPAHVVRCWQIVDEGDGTFTGVLRTQARIEARTERGALHLVRETIDSCYRYRGAPLWPRIVQPKRGAA